MYGTNPYQFDAENRIVQFSNGPAYGGEDYVYDANGRRIEKITSTGQVHYFYDRDGQALIETDQNGNWTKEYGYMGGQHVAEFAGGLTYFIHRDHLGSVRTITSYQGYVSYDNDYLPFGEQILGGNWETHQFAGYERDYNSTLDYANARFYSASIGRFMSPDPTGIFLGNLNDPQSLNLYGYVRNNPLSATDPSGLCGGDFGDDCCDFCFPFPIPPIPIGGGDGGRVGPQRPISIPPGVGTNPNPPSGTLTSDDPFGGETNGIPNGVRIPTLGLPGLLLPGNPGCEFGPCPMGIASNPISQPIYTLPSDFAIKIWVTEMLGLLQSSQIGSNPPPRRPKTWHTFVHEFLPCYYSEIVRRTLGDGSEDSDANAAAIVGANILLAVAPNPVTLAVAVAADAYVFIGAGITCQQATQ